jgi:hypothetical protein
VCLWIVGCHVTIELLNSVFLSELQTSQTSSVTFKNAFENKSDLLEKTLKVTDDLLLKLKDARLLEDYDVRWIKYKAENSSKVKELLDKIGHRNDSLLIDFCKILKTVGQFNVVRTIIPKEDPIRFELIREELEKIIEPDCGLPAKLYSSEVIDNEQLVTVIQQKPVHRRVSCLLEAIEQNWGSVKVEYFLQMLKEDGQSHVVNFIRENGEIDASLGDVRPLNEQQRRRLMRLRTMHETLDLCGGKLLEMLQNRNALSARQVNDIMSKEHSEKRNKRLLRILSRRSVADIKQFIVSLYETNQHCVVQWLTEVGAVVRINTTIDQSQMSSQHKMENQKQFVLNFSSVNRSSKGELAAKVCQGLESVGHQIVNVDIEEEHVTWYIMCRTLHSCDRLRYMYEGPSSQLIKILEWIFNCLFVDEEKLQLSMDWSIGDYANCQSFLTATSGRAFEMIKEDDEVRKNPEMTVCVAV